MEVAETKQVTALQDSRKGSTWMPLMAIIALALGVRLALLLGRPMVIEAEGAYYAREAENLANGAGMVGIHAWGLQLLYPPLYPLLTAAFYHVIPNVELAARLVSLLFGSCLVIPIFLIARELYGERVGYIAAVLVAVHPVLVGFSTAVYSEATYFVLLYLGIYLGVYSARRQSCAKALAGGAILGLAYLTRAEALVTVGFLAMLILACGWKDRLRATKVTACLLVTCMVVCAPYVLFLKAKTGQFRLEAKSADNFAYGQLLLAGMKPIEAYRLVDDNLNPIGVSMRSNLEVMQSTKITMGLAVRFVRAIAPKRIREVINAFVSNEAFGGMFLVSLMTMGIFGSAWDRKRAFQEGVLVAYLGCLFVPLLSLFAFNSRFIVLLLPILLIWVAKGVEALGVWACATMRNIAPFQERSKFIKNAAIMFASGVMLIFAWLSFGRFEELRSSDHSLKTAGLALKTKFPHEKLVIMDMDPVVAFYAGGILRPYPYSSEQTALRYISSNSVNVLVIREKSESGIPYYQEWTKAGVKDTRANLLCEIPSDQYGRILLYQWHEIRARAM